MRAAIAVTRFGLGAKPGALAEARRDPQGFLRSQIRRAGADQPEAPASSAERMAQFRDYRRERLAARLETASDQRPSASAAAMADASAKGQDARDPVKAVGRMLRQDVGADFEARARLAAATDAGFRARRALIWANHFTVSATKA